MGILILSCLHVLYKNTARVLGYRDGSFSTKESGYRDEQLTCCIISLPPEISASNTPKDSVKHTVSNDKGIRVYISGTFTVPTD